MKPEVLPSEDGLAQRAAELIAEAAREAVAARGHFTLAVSGGRTPGRMLARLATQPMPWHAVHLFQVDERIAPAGDADRNYEQLRTQLLARVPIAASHVHAMPVEEGDPRLAATTYATTLGAVTGVPPVLDLVHLGLGSDGHTASLIPGDPVLDVTDRDIALSGPYQGRMRMTMTYPLLARARAILWLVSGADKAAALARLCRADPSIPAGRIAAGRARLLVDAPAAADLR